MGYDAAAFLVLTALALFAAQALGGRVDDWVPPRLLLIAVALRVVGSTARYEVIWRFYDGVGDAVLYFWDGLKLSTYILDNPFYVLTPGFWSSAGNWWGTAFIKKIAAIVLTVTGPSMRAGFLAFSLLSFVGLFAIAKAFRNVHPGPQTARYAQWLWLWPSLWFWPSSLGKEALLVLGIGLFFLGFSTSKGLFRWAMLGMGMGLTFCIRPHVALVLAMAAVAGYWLGSWERMTFRRILEIVAALTLCAAAFLGMRAQFGLEGEGFEGIAEFVEDRSEQTLKGGSNIGTAPLGLTGVPVAFVNVWMRPFPWEAHNATAAFAALEISVFWFLVWQRRRDVGVAMRHWRKHPLLRFSIPFLLLYTLMIGITFGNLGIIARQRAPIFPFILMILVVVPKTVAVRRARNDPGVASRPGQSADPALAGAQRSR